jgi:hypothetical protein
MYPLEGKGGSIEYLEHHRRSVCRALGAKLRLQQQRVVQHVDEGRDGAPSRPTAHAVQWLAPHPRVAQEQLRVELAERARRHACRARARALPREAHEPREAARV